MDVGRRRELVLERAFVRSDTLRLGAIGPVPAMVAVARIAATFDQSPHAPPADRADGLELAHGPILPPAQSCRARGINPKPRTESPRYDDTRKPPAPVVAAGGSVVT